MFLNEQCIEIDLWTIGYWSCLFILFHYKLDKTRFRFLLHVYLFGWLVVCLLSHFSSTMCERIIFILKVVHCLFYYTLLTSVLFYQIRYMNWSSGLYRQVYLDPGTWTLWCSSTRVPSIKRYRTYMYMYMFFVEPRTFLLSSFVCTLTFWEDL